VATYPLEAVFDPIYFRRAASGPILEFHVIFIHPYPSSLLVLSLHSINKQLREEGYGEEIFLSRHKSLTESVTLD
jgi:hypothetical protein